MIVPYNDDSQLLLAAQLGKEKVQEQMVSGFRTAVELGKEYGLPVCFETTPHEVLALSGTEDCVYVLDQVPGLELVFDTANMLPHGENTLEAYEALKDRIAYVHLKDVALDPADPERPLAEHAKDGRIMRGVAWGDGTIPVAESRPVWNRAAIQASMRWNTPIRAALRSRPMRHRWTASCNI